MSLPGWDSVETVTKLAKVFTGLGLASLGLVAVFDILAWIYSNRKDVLVDGIQQASARHQQEEQTQAEKAHQKEMANLRDQLHGSAKEVEQLKELSADRTLSGHEKEELTKAVEGFPAGTISVTGMLGNDESCQYAEQFADLFFSVGKLKGPKGINRAIVSAQFTGIILVLHSNTDSMVSIARGLQETLEQLGISAPGAVDAAVAEGTLDIRIGRKSIPK